MPAPSGMVDGGLAAAGGLAAGRVLQVAKRLVLLGRRPVVAFETGQGPPPIQRRWAGIERVRPGELLDRLVELLDRLVEPAELAEGLRQRGMGVVMAPVERDGRFE